MALVHRDYDNLVRIVAPVLNAVPELWDIIRQRDTTIAVLQARITILEGELDVERGRREQAEDGQDQAAAEAQRWYHETLRLEARLP